MPVTATMNKSAACSKYLPISKQYAPLRAALHVSCSALHMFSSLIRIISVPAVLAMLAGCASTPVRSVDVNQLPLSLAEQLGTVAAGTEIELASDNALGLQTVRVQETYTAASGRFCRRLALSSGQPLARITCQRQSGEWYFPRSLQHSSTMVAPAQNYPVLNDVVDQADSAPQAVLVQEALRNNETLWSFARRVTGNALNWSHIAELNNISDAAQMSSGAVLDVPATMIARGR